MKRRWCLEFFFSFLLLLIVLGGLTAVIDPYFHYHKPLDSLGYRMYNERYLNDGIVKHFDYDALITGTSMVQNFKCSEMDELFGTRSIKVPFMGGAYKEISENLVRAFDANPDLQVVLWGLDYNRFYEDFNATSSASYPTYLYDDNLLNDANYLFNKSVLFGATCRDTIIYTISGGKTPTFDEYNNWNSDYVFGREAVLAGFSRPGKVADAAYEKLNPENIEKNILPVVKANPDTEFYLFWTPYSIVYFDGVNQTGVLKNILQWEKEALELLLPYDNVHFFSIFDDFEVITNLDNYKDPLHYCEDINSYLLKCMANGEHEITLDNYEEYCQRIWDFYTTYDYDAIYE